MSDNKVYYYFINLDERGEFYADIRDENDNTIVEIDTEYAEFLTQEGVNIRNVTSLWNYYRLLGDLPVGAILTKGQG